MDSFFSSLISRFHLDVRYAMLSVAFLLSRKHLFQSPSLDISPRIPLTPLPMTNTTTTSSSLLFRLFPLFLLSVIFILLLQDTVLFCMRRASLSKSHSYYDVPLVATK